MRIKSIVVTMVVLLVAGIAHGQQTYLLNPGDKVLIEVWNEPDMQRDVLILPDGNISFPLAGQIPAAGTTTQQLQNTITERLSQYLSSPVVTISVTEMTGNSIYLIGQVNSPGVFVMSRPMTALQALSLSGGFTAFAQTKRIKIIRKSPDGEQVLRVNYDDLAGGNNLQTNHLLRSGDVLVVP